jgi:hypothetical protein
MGMSKQDKTNYKRKYNEENYKRIGLYVSDEVKKALEAHRDETGESINAYINRLIAEDMKGE